MAITGTVQNVVDHVYGSELTGDHATGATSLTVVWTNDFNADGGSLYFADPDTGDVVETIAYTIPHDDEDVPSETEIDLATPLANDYADATPVYVFPKMVERWCWFMPSDGEEVIVARVPHNLVPLLKPDARDGDDAEQIECEQIGTDLVVSDVLARSAVQDLNSVVVTTSPDGIDPQTWMDKNGLNMSMESTSGAQVESVKWWNGGTVKAYVQPIFNVAGMSKLQILLWDEARAGFAHLDLQTPNNNTPNSAYRVSINANGQSKTLIDGDGASDYELATSGGWQDWSPTLSGWSASPTNTVYRYRQSGKTVEMVIRQGTNGTSNATTKSISLPVTAATISNMVWAVSCAAVDNGTQLSTPSHANITSAGTTVTFDKDLSAAGGWTASGAHRIRTCQITYEAA